jgi:hypothetical protein
LHGITNGLDLALRVCVVFFQHYPGIVDEDVETPEIASYPAHALLDAFVIGDIELPRFDGKMLRDQLARGTSTFGGVSRAKDDANAELRELSTDLEANSAVASRNESDLLLGHFSAPIMNILPTE